MIHHTNNLNAGYSFFESLCFLVDEVANNKDVVTSKRARVVTPKLSKKLWPKIRLYCLSLFENKCAKCNSRPEVKDLHVDHIKPKSKYPHLKYKIYNLQLLCKKCNFEKGNKNCIDYRDIKFVNNALLHE